jgi:hypothetical protein
VGGGGVTPPKKSKKGGPNLRGGGPGMLELQNFLKMKISSLKILEISGKKLLKKVVCFLNEIMASPFSWDI